MTTRHNDRGQAMPANLPTRGIAAVLASFGVVAVIAALYWMSSLETAPPVHHSSKGGRVDPWRPLPGCLNMTGPEGQPIPWLVDAATTLVCRSGRATSKPVAQSDVPGEYNELLRSLGPLRAPLRIGGETLVKARMVDGHRIVSGADVQLTLRAASQQRASQLLACLSGESSACAPLGIGSTAWASMAEGAALRSGALLVMDIHSGAIEVLASGRSRCFQAEEEGKALPPHCPPSARERGARPWKLQSPAMFADEMPGSLAKLPMILSLLRDPETGPALLRDGAAQERFLQDIAHSETANFLDRIFCKERDYQSCGRIEGVEAAAADLGWNRPRLNYLSLGRTGNPGLVLNAPAGRFMRQPVTQVDATVWASIPPRYSPAAAKRCAEQPGNQRWSKCNTEALANLVSELWGQGNARVSPMAVADGLAHLAAAANGATEVAAPHLLHSVTGRHASNSAEVRLTAEAMARPLAVAPSHAQLILRGLALTHRTGGTAYTACLKALGSGRPAEFICANLKGVAGKTGTPVFNHDQLRVDERARRCAALRATLAENVPERRHAVRNELTQCQVAPLKWYAAVIRDDPTQESGPWTKVVVALAERNWKQDGRIDAALDRGSNIAAEMVFRFLLGNKEMVDVAQ